MRLALPGALFVLIACSTAHAQESAVPPHKLARMGLGGMRLVMDDFPQPRSGYQILPPPPGYELHPGDVHEPAIIGQRQFHTLQALRHQDQVYLKRNAWRWAHRNGRGLGF